MFSNNQPLTQEEKQFRLQILAYKERLTAKDWIELRDGKTSTEILIEIIRRSKAKVPRNLKLAIDEYKMLCRIGKQFSKWLDSKHITATEFPLFLQFVNEHYPSCRKINRAEYLHIAEIVNKQINLH